MIASAARPQAYHCVRGVVLSFLTIAALAGFDLENVALAAEPSKTGAAIEERVQALIPDIEAYVASGMKEFDVPGLAIGIVAGDKLVYAKGFGVRSKGNSVPVDTRTTFQIGSTTKAFLATTLAIMVDRGKLRWDDRVVDLDPNFQLKDPWVTREFRVFDLLAQRSGLPPYVNDGLGILGLDEAALIRSLRYVEPVSSFRSTFAYTNITHLLAGRIVAKAAGAADGDTVVRQELLDPLGMKDSSYTAAAIEAATNHAEGHRWTPDGTIEVPFTQLFPYDFGGLATSTPQSKIWRAGSACSSVTAASKGAALSPPKILPLLTRQRWRSPRSGSTPWAGSFNRRRTATSFGMTAVLTASAPMSAWCLIRMLALSSSPTRRIWVSRMRSDYGLWTGFLTIPKSTTWRTRLSQRKPNSRR
jgi:CubicO group peptidase (beta-lactamase class C family)